MKSTETPVAIALRVMVRRAVRISNATSSVATATPDGMEDP